MPKPNEGEKYKRKPTPTAMTAMKANRKITDQSTPPSTTSPHPYGSGSSFSVDVISGPPGRLSLWLTLTAKGIAAIRTALSTKNPIESGVSTLDAGYALLIAPNPSGMIVP